MCQGKGEKGEGEREKGQESGRREEGQGRKSGPKCPETRDKGKQPIVHNLKLTTYNGGQAQNSQHKTIDFLIIALTLHSDPRIFL